MCLLDFGGLLAWVWCVCVCLCCQYINIQYSGLQLCALMYSITVCICVPTCSHLHVLPGTSGIPRHEAINFIFVPVTCCLITGEALSVLCGTHLL